MPLAVPELLAAGMTRRLWPVLALIATLNACTSAAGTDHPRRTAGAVSAAQITAALRQVPVIAHRPDRAGYDRSCRRGHACSFGPAWSDATAAPGGHNGCDTRNDVLAAQLRRPQLKPGTHRCVVIAGELHDPYTGQTVQFARAQAGRVPIDHALPLALAWDLGAADWPPSRRAQFANDPRELIVTTQAVNESKGDRGLSTWLPPNKPYRCAYVLTVLTVAHLYQLPITAADAAAAQRVARGC